VTDEVIRPRPLVFVEDALKEATASIGPHGVAQVACGGQHTILLDSNGKVRPGLATTHLID